MTKKRFKTQLLIIFTLVFCISGLIKGDTGLVVNTLEDLRDSEGKINLKLDFTWGDDDTDDLNKAFYFPGDIQIDAVGNFYLLDSGNHRIQVFDKSRNYIRSIGKKGKGPADLLAAGSVALTKTGNIVVADSSNYRVQTFDPEGKSLHSFRTGPVFLVDLSVSPADELLLYLPKKGAECRWALSMYDLNGLLKKEIVSFPCINKSKSAERISFLADSSGDIVISYYHIPLLQKLSKDGKKRMALSYEVPLKTPAYQVPEVGCGATISLKKNETVHDVLSDFTVDRQGRIFLVACTRPLAPQEKVYFTGIGGAMARMPKEFPEETDLHRLLVFNSKGKLIATKKLPFFCDRVYIHGKRLFFIDKIRNMKIYEYQFTL